MTVLVPESSYLPAVTSLVAVHHRAARVARRFGLSARWRGALIAMHEREGQLTAVWRSAEDHQVFAPLLRVAWRAGSQYAPVEHLTACGRLA